MTVPTNLGHKPIIAVKDYEQIDGIYQNNTDAKALSIGRAQYDSDEISLKVFRYAGQWSRQSEELPIHRVLDLSILLLRTLCPDSVAMITSSISERMVDMDQNGQGQKEILDYCRQNRQYFLPRLEEMKYLLEKVNYKEIM